MTPTELRSLLARALPLLNSQTHHASLRCNALFPLIKEITAALDRPRAGKPSPWTAEQRAEMLRLIAGRWSMREVADHFATDPATVSRQVRYQRAQNKKGLQQS